VGQIKKGQEKVKTYSKRKSFWEKNWIVTGFAIVFFFSLLMGSFNNESDIPDYMDSIDIPEDTRDPFQEPVKSVTEQFEQSNEIGHISSTELFVDMFFGGKFSTMFMILLTLPFAFVFAKAIFGRGRFRI